MSFIMKIVLVKLICNTLHTNHMLIESIIQVEIIGKTHDISVSQLLLAF